MARFKAKEITLDDGRRGQSSFDNEARTPLIILLAVTGTVLLIACANIANLLLVRGAGRAAEMAVRLSIGANRRQLITQLLTESILLAAFGAVADCSSRSGRSTDRLDHAGGRGALISFELSATMLMFAGG